MAQMPPTAANDISKRKRILWWRKLFLPISFLNSRSFGVPLSGGPGIKTFRVRTILRTTTQVSNSRYYELRNPLDRASEGRAAGLADRLARQHFIEGRTQIA